jgi:hypothetical protein
MVKLTARREILADSGKPGKAGLWKRARCGRRGRKRERREEGREEQRPRVFQFLLSGGGSKIKFGGEEGGKEIKQEEGRRTQRVCAGLREGRQADARWTYRFTRTNYNEIFAARWVLKLEYESSR